MVGVEKVRLPAPESRPYTAFGVALGVDLLVLPLIFVMVYVWPIVILAIVPYVGGRLGGRYATRREATWAGGVAGALEVTVLVSLFIYLLSRLPGADLNLLEPIGLTLTGLAYVLGISFGALGGAHGAKAKKSRAAA
jgi:hypothetical protein